MLLVQKYGGTSVGSIERIKAVAERVVRAQRAGNRVTVVVSAMAGETDRLLGLARAIGCSDPRELDVLLASGEQVSISLVALAIRAAGGDALSFLAHQINVMTDSAHSRARIHTIDGPRLKTALAEGKIPVVAGFQGIDAEGNVTTLGRGGSDTSAVAIAASLANELGEQVACEIYTDVDGVFTADPSICPDARPIPRITYEEMLELASLGAKVLQVRSVELASKFLVPLHVRSSFTDTEGTMVVPPDATLEQVAVTGVSLDRNQCRVTLRSLPHRTGVQSDVFRPLGDAGVVIDMIVQNPPADGRFNISFTAPHEDLATTLELLRPLAEREGATLISDDDVAKISIVGVAMRSHSGIAQRMFDLLAAAEIDIRMIGTSEIKVSCIIARDQGEAAVRALHAGFGLGRAESA